MRPTVRQVILALLKYNLDDYVKIENNKLQVCVLNKELQEKLKDNAALPLELEELRGLDESDIY